LNSKHTILLVFVSFMVLATPLVMGNSIHNQTSSKENDINSNAEFSEFSIPTSGSNPLEVIMDGNYAWFTEQNRDKIGMLDKQTGSIVEYNVPTAGSYPAGLVKDGDNIWFTEFYKGKIGRVEKSTTTVFEYTVGTASTTPFGIAIGGVGGDIWFTQSYKNRISRFNQSTSALTSYNIPTSGSTPTGIALNGIDGDVWFVEYQSGKLGCFNQSIDSIQEYDIPTSGSNPIELTIDTTTGDIWFAEYTGNRIGRYAPATGLFTEYLVPTQASNPSGLCIDEINGIVWFTEASKDTIGRLEIATGNIREYQIPTSGGYPSGIALDSDGSVWFTELYGNKIGHLIVTIPTAVIKTPVTGDKMYVGDKKRIEWNLTDGTAPYMLWVNYTADGGISWTEVSGDNPLFQDSSGDAYLNWTVPNKQSANCKLKIEVYDCEGYHGNKTTGLFTILAHGKPTPPPPVVTEHRTTITIVQAGDWIQGNTGDVCDNIGDIITIKAEVQCSDGISTVELLYKGVGDTDYTTVNMVMSSGAATKGIWQIDIPAQSSSGNVMYVVHAVSATGEEASTQPSYIVIDGQDMSTGQFVLIVDDWGMAMLGAIAISMVIVIYLLYRRRDSRRS